MPDSSENILWAQEVNASKAWMLFGFSFPFYALIIVLHFFFIKNFTFYEILNLDIVSIVQIVSETALYIFLIAGITINLVVASTIKYSITKNSIHFNWGLFKNKQVIIPFNEITRIKLVEYNNKNTSTIYFATKSEFKVKKLNFDSGESRALVTFEKIEHGKEVYKLLQKLWNENKSST